MRQTAARRHSQWKLSYHNRAQLSTITPCLCLPSVSSMAGCRCQAVSWKCPNRHIGRIWVPPTAHRKSSLPHEQMKHHYLFLEDLFTPVPEMISLKEILTVFLTATQTTRHLQKDVCWFPLSRKWDCFPKCNDYFIAVFYLGTHSVFTCK
jgi:hypothetical protein